MGTFLKYVFKLWTVLLTWILFVFPFQVGLSNSIPVFNLEGLSDGVVTLNQNWKFHPGDNPSWADPDWDDRYWKPIDPTTDIHYLTELREAEIGWFRLHLDVDPSLLDIPLAMIIYQRGASEIYLNGKLIHKLGKVSQDPEEEVIFNPNFTPYSFQFQAGSDQVFAVRFSFTARNPYMNFLGLWGGNPTLIIGLDHMDNALQSMVQKKAIVTSRLVGKSTFLLFLALLHLFFFITYPANKTNLYFSLFTISLAFGYFLEHVFRFMPREGDSYFNVGLISSLFFSTFIIWGILAVYSFAKEKLDGLFLFATLSALLFIPTWKWPYEAANYYWPYFFTMGPFIAVIVSGKAVKKKIRGAWVIFLGWIGNFILWTLFCLFLLNILPRFAYDTAITLDLAIFCAAISFSGLLSIEYAQTKRSLQTSLRLLQAVNHFLELSKLEAVKLNLEKEPGEIIGFVKRLSGTFASQMESKGIKFIQDLPEAPLYLYFDHDKLGKILSNLLINAFNVTPTGGQVYFKVFIITERASDVQMHFNVKDSGIGISSERLPHIFERFYQEEASATRTYEGTGIGLALVRELTELLGGTITVESNSESGTIFNVELLFEKVAHDAISEMNSTEYISPMQITERQSTNIDHQLAEPTRQDTLPTVLIIEDNPDLRHFITQNLKELYTVLEAENGMEGFIMATEIIPDLIIADVMLPVMDGISLSDRVKSDERTSHIPFILLTARADSESKISGLETGVDAFLTKPFEMKELKVRIHHLMKGREKLREKFSRSLSLEPSEIAVTSTDEKFLSKALNILEENLMNTEFDVKLFSREIGMSRTNLHRKLKALTDYSATEFIRVYRLKRAKYLLEQKAGNISEVAYSVGFTSVGYFTKCFKNQYGLTPSEFINKTF